MQDQQKLIKQSKNCWLITFGTGKWTLQQLWRQIFCFSCFNLWCEACSGELKGEQNYCRRKCCKVMQLFVGAIRSNFDMISLDSFHSPSLPNLRQQLPSTVSGQKYSQKITTTNYNFPILFGEKNMSIGLLYLLPWNISLNGSKGASSSSRTMKEWKMPLSSIGSNKQWTPGWRK